MLASVLGLVVCWACSRTLNGRIGSFRRYSCRFLLFQSHELEPTIGAGDTKAFGVFTTPRSTQPLTHGQEDLTDLL